MLPWLENHHRTGHTEHVRAATWLTWAVATSGSRYGNIFAPFRAVSQFDLRIETVVGEQIGAPGPAGLSNPRIDLVLRLGRGRSRSCGS